MIKSAQNRTRTCMPLDTRTWNVRVYQFRHLGSFKERKTRLELATPTLARLCSTNWAISAFLISLAKVGIFYKPANISGTFLQDICSVCFLWHSNKGWMFCTTECSINVPILRKAMRIAPCMLCSIRVKRKRFCIFPVQFAPMRILERP